MTESPNAPAQTNTRDELLNEIATTIAYLIGTALVIFYGLGVMP